jgi:phage terminase large subunit
MCSFKSPVIGSYYGDAMSRAEREGRITTVPINETVPVDTWWDLGIDDSMTIWFVQQVGQEIHLVDYYENSGEGLAHYAMKMQEKKLLYGRHFGPHDIAVRELGTGKSRLEVAKSLGIKFEVGPRLEIDDGINAARSIFNQCWFDKDKCSRGINALKNYHKEWDEKNKVFRTTPKHDWSSHGADGFRTGAVGYKKQIEFKQTSFGGVNPYIEGIG